MDLLMCCVVALSYYLYLVTVALSLLLLSCLAVSLSCLKLLGGLELMHDGS